VCPCSSPSEKTHIYSVTFLIHPNPYVPLRAHYPPKPLCSPEGTLSTQTPTFPWGHIIHPNPYVPPRAHYSLSIITGTGTAILLSKFCWHQHLESKTNVSIYDPIFQTCLGQTSVLVYTVLMMWAYSQRFKVSFTCEATLIPYKGNILFVNVWLPGG
jgi:hypothetical protein